LSFVQHNEVLKRRRSGQHLQPQMSSSFLSSYMS